VRLPRSGVVSWDRPAPTGTRGALLESVLSFTALGGSNPPPSATETPADLRERPDHRGRGVRTSGAVAPRSVTGRHRNREQGPFSTWLTCTRRPTIARRRNSSGGGGRPSNPPARGRRVRRGSSRRSAPPSSPSKRSDARRPGAQRRPHPGDLAPCRARTPAPRRTGAVPRLALHPRQTGRVRRDEAELPAAGHRSTHPAEETGPASGTDDVGSLLDRLELERALAELAPRDREVVALFHSPTFPWSTSPRSSPSRPGR
jgi:hypothetical protein